jgi:molybdate transport system ATP-binding protein
VEDDVTRLLARMVVARSETFSLDVDLAIEPGSTVALLGPNGSGKTTAVQALAGLLPIDEGRITLGATVFDDPQEGIFIPPEERRVGVVFQDYLLFPHLSVLENIAFGLRSRRRHRDQALAVAHAWVERMGLDQVESKRPGDVSGGQAQRVALGRALATDPEVLLLDEPMAALDVTTRAEMRRSLADHLAGFDGPRLLITHDPLEAFLLADLVYVVEGGRVTQSGTPEEIRLRPRTNYAADLAGSNLITGEAKDGVVDVGAHVVHVADHEVAGPVLLMIPPTAIAIHLHRPEGSPRNSWPTRVVRVEPRGDRVRLQVSEPLPLAVEVTRDAAEALALRPGLDVWVAVKATEIGIQVDGRGGSSRGDAGDPVPLDDGDADRRDGDHRRSRH